MQEELHCCLKGTVKKQAMAKFNLNIGNIRMSLGVEKSIDDTKALNENWQILAEHMQAKVRQREQSLSFLHTKAGFVLASIALIAQLLPSTDTLATWQLILLWSAASLLLVAFCSALWSLFINKSTTAPAGDVMGKTLLEEPEMDRNEFYKWLAESYQAAYEGFGRVYARKDNAIRVSAVAVVIAFVLIMVIRFV